MNRAAVIGIIAVVVIAAGVLASPLFYETEVDEALPTGITPEEFLGMDDEERDAVSETMSEEEKEAIMDESAGTVVDVSEDMAGDDKSAVEILGLGQFIGLDGHSASGTAKIISVEGQPYLRFEDFRVTNGPDLRVYLSPTESVRDGVQISDLKGSRGDQNYELSQSDLDNAGYVIIYCQPFHVYFASAQLT